jgi:hypothetical protein
MFESRLSRRKFIAASGVSILSLSPLRTSAAVDGVEAVTEGGVLHVRGDGRPVFDYRLRGELPDGAIKPNFLRAGYMHPVYTPGGRIVTDDYPDDHPHQHGIFFAWTKTEFEGRHPDFWNMGDGTGAVELEKLETSWSGKDSGGFSARLRHVDLSGPTRKTALNEVWKVTVYRGAPGFNRYFMFDLVSTQECASNSPLILPDYRYGGVGIRGHRQWRVKANVSFLTSEGKDRISGDDTTARWCAISGRVDGQPVGLVALCHPENFRAPQPLRIHPDDPYFNFSPSKRGAWRITPGKPYVSRYRFLTFDGAPNAAELDRLWNDYAKG